VTKNIYWFNEITKDSIRVAGGKAANLGEMFQIPGLPIPAGFVVSSEAYFDFIRGKGIDEVIKRQTSSLNVEDTRSLQQASEAIKRAIIESDVPQDIHADVVRAYNKISGVDLIPTMGKEARVAVRSSATAEDLPTASFAGQQASFLNIKGPDEVVRAVKKCWASLFEARAIYYRKTEGFDDLKVGLAAAVQLMVESDQSGVMFTIDPVAQNPDELVIEAGLGLGEAVVSGMVTPDRYHVDKYAMRIVDKDIAKQTEMIVYAKSGGTETVNVPEELQTRQKITDDQILKLARYGTEIEQHYGAPQDIEWAIQDNEVFIVQSRGITTLKAQLYKQRVQPQQQTTAPLVKGLAASPGSATGPVRIVLDPRDIDKVKKGDILVAKMTSPDYVPAMKRAAAIITDAGGITAHAAIVSRELGIPAVVGTRDATMVLHEGQQVFVDAVKGEVYDAAKAPKPAPQQQTTAKTFQQPSYAPTPTPTEEEGWSAVKPPKPESFITPFSSVTPHAMQGKTKLYVNLAQPDEAQRVASKAVDGVGLFRAEFLIAGLGMHPNAAVKQGKRAEFVKLVEEGMKALAKAFHPRPVYYRANDFKSNEYRHLKGGEQFEPEEENPMIGYRGCFRYIKDRTVFEMELEAMKRVRKEYKNLQLMIPFVRTVKELREVKQIVENSGLRRGEDGFEFGIMCEMPSNVIFADGFCAEGIDFMSIGSNDLTQLTLGIDRDSAIVAEEFDERNPAVLRSIRHVIKTCHQYGVKVSICGQAPSIHDEYTDFLVDSGIDSISVNIDAIDKVRSLMNQAESAARTRRNATGGFGFELSP
jgi:pyruvate,water dikinase